MTAAAFRSFFVIPFLLHLSFIPGGGQNRFIYIQTENKQAFYVKMDKRILSSSASGYMIISKLIDSVYKFSIGFPKNEWPEQNVTISLKEADAGYLLKNLGEKGWGLFNLQTREVLMAQKKMEDSNVVETEKTGDEFASILASVVNDPSINKRLIIKSEEPLTSEGTSESKTEEKLVVKEEPTTKGTPEPKTEEKLVVKEDPVLDKVNISKLRVDTSAEGILLYYVDIVNGIADTVKLFIPVEKPAVTEELVKQEEPPKLLPVTDDPKNKDSRFIDMELPNPNLKTDSGVIKTNDSGIMKKKPAAKKLPDSYGDSAVRDPGTKKSMINPDCKKLAVEKDFLNLRKQMAAEENADGMIRVASKQLIKICFSTEQIKNLGVLFITEGERYKFFVAAFHYVSDPQNYGLLQDQLTDEYYISRFKAMIHN